MRVLCINDNWIKEVENMPSPKFGDEDDVTGLIRQNGAEYYQLGNRFYHKSGFLSSHFIPLSEIDEMQLVEEKELLF